MRLGWGRDDGPFFVSCPGRKPHERCEPGPILLCMGLFSRFCVSGLRGVPRRGAALRPGHEIVSASRSRRIDPTPMHHAHRRDITHMILVTGAGGKTGVAVLKALVAR